jgi:serine/threonine protein phosphatase PrpC
VNGCRVDQLSVSRAFGDFNLKKEKHKTGKNLINCKPDVRVHQIDYRKDEFIVLCSDGVLEGFQSDQKLIDFIRERYRNTKIMEQVH